MTKRSAARKKRDESKYTAVKAGAKLTHEQMEEHAVKVLSKMRPSLSYPELIKWVEGLSDAERGRLSAQVLNELTK